MISQPIIKDVYADDLDEAMLEISKIIEDYPIIGIDTEFPGTFYDPNKIAAAAGIPPLSSLAGSY